MIRWCVSVCVNLPRAQAFRLPAPGLASGAGRPTDESEKTLSAVSRGEADGAPARRPQAGLGYACTDDTAAHDQPALVARLRFGHPQRWPTFSDPVRGR